MLYLAPFLALIKASDVSGPITGAAAVALQRILTSELLGGWRGGNGVGVGWHRSPGAGAVMGQVGVQCTTASLVYIIALRFQLCGNTSNACPALCNVS